MATAPVPIILDCDPGHDDAVALLLSAGSPAIDLRLVTVVAGNQTLDRTLRNALGVLTVAGATHIPVAAGADRPLVRPRIVAGNIHGESGLDGPVMPEPTIQPSSRHAVDLIIEIIQGSPGAITVVPTGPLTNIALALRMAPAIAFQIKEIVLMGGSIGLGNTTPAAEFNIHADPEAAAIVFGSGVPLTMIGLDVTYQTQATSERRARIDALGTPLAALVGGWLDFFGSRYREVFGLAGPPLHDPCAVAQVIHPGIVRTQPMAVEIDISHGPSYGRTVCDQRAITGRPVNTQVGVAIDVDGFYDLLVETLARYPAP
ncbi:MAG TPA: nucleoside hydrolase [Chloroflexota bacterium]|nr:nucleoside hydrolase [Chloroflexota bacterium]